MPKDVSLSVMRAHSCELLLFEGIPLLPPLQWSGFGAWHGAFFFSSAFASFCRVSDESLLVLVVFFFL